MLRMLDRHAHLVLLLRSGYRPLRRSFAIAPVEVPVARTSSPVRHTPPAHSHSWRSERGSLSSSFPATMTCAVVHRIARAARRSSTPPDHTTRAITRIEPRDFTGTLLGISRFATTHPDCADSPRHNATLREHVFEGWASCHGASRADPTASHAVRG